MTEEENIRSLREGNDRLEFQLAARRDRDRAAQLLGALGIKELRWLEKDYEDEKDGDWTR